jgi:carboxymethylenebutenolidase
VLGLFGGADAGHHGRRGGDLRRGPLSGRHAEHDDHHATRDAPHSFFDRKQEDFAQASADAWERVLEFIRANTPAA